MRFTTGTVLAAAGLAAAQSSTASLAAASSTVSAATYSSTAVSGCGKQIDTIIQTCLATENAQLDLCGANDWDCLCAQSTNVLTCYNNCPGDPNAFGAQQQKISYCNAAKAYGSSSSSATISATASVSSALSSALASESSTLAAITSGAAGATSSGSASAQETGASAADSDTSGASTLAPAGLAAIFGLAALL